MSPRQIAQERGFTTYEGPPCHNGHSGVRYTKSATCVICMKATRRAQLDKLKRAA